MSIFTDFIAFKSSLFKCNRKKNHGLENSAVYSQFGRLNQRVLACEISDSVVGEG